MSNEEKIDHLNFQVTKIQDSENLPLPGILSTSTRSGTNEIDPLLKDVVAEKVYEISSALRGDPKGETKKIKPKDEQLLALEAEDGTTIFIRSDKLTEDIERVRPEAVSASREVDFEAFLDPNASSRGLGDVFWKAVTVLKLPKDGLIDEAKELALEWAKETAVGKLKDVAYDTGSFYGAKALMRLIENRLAGNPGLYEWNNRHISHSDRCGPDDERLEKASRSEPMLLCIHGTASYTESAFDDLRTDNETWTSFTDKFPGGVFGYEHRTFSQSPIENALELAEALPKNTRLCILSHSRGGLVGDLLCLGRNINQSVIESYTINKHNSDDPEGLEQEEIEERRRLKLLLQTLSDKNIVVLRYVRVASPARGTRLLSENLDVALSDFTNLLQTAGGALAGTVAGAIGGPAAAKVFHEGASSVLGVVKRLALEIAGRRIDPKLIPGIAAMRIDSPIAAFLAHPETRRHDQTEIAVIAGDTEFDSFGFSDFRRRIVNLFCDWRMFDQQDNDLVVDTDSMYAGLGFEQGVRYLLDQASYVTHFRYFINPDTRDALRNWLIQENTDKVEHFSPISSDKKIPWDERDTKAKKREGPTGPRPVVIIIPGIMGSHIEVGRKQNKPRGSGNRIWFDMASLAIGDLDRISYPESKNVYSEDIFERFYGDLADELQNTHNVYRSPYDWRKPLEECAKELREVIIEAVKENPGQPIRLLAHSMGGLVVRVLIKKHPGEWKSIIESKGRLIMLGTPNNGAHMMAHTLLGKNDSVRLLSKFDFKHNLQQILDIVKDFPGALSLLPRFDFKDTGHQSSIDTKKYYDESTWNDLKSKNKDFWYGNEIAGIPEQKTLKSIQDLWESGTLKDNSIYNPDHVIYVFGQGEKTACGVKETDTRLQLLFTRDGDGTVTWKSGQLKNLADNHYWYMPVEHGDLLNVPDYFPAIVDLLETGSTNKLERLPRSRSGEEAETFILEAAPPVVPSEDELMRVMTGSSMQRFKPISSKKKIKISVLAGDLYFCKSPVICGHYYGDVISGAENVLDDIVDRQLTQRQRLGVYADAVGTSTIVIMPRNKEDIKRNSTRGTIIVGLGEMNGRLSSNEVTQSVRAGMLQYLLRMQETPEECQTKSIKVSSLLIGHNSTAHISINESLLAITRGICEANNKFADDKFFVSEIEFIELYRDISITAANSIRSLPSQMCSELERMNIQLEINPHLKVGEGCRNRLWAMSAGDYWPRLIVTDADKQEESCPPGCTPEDDMSHITLETLRELVDDCQDNVEKNSTGKNHVHLHAKSSEYPNRLRYIFVSQRARSESTAIQRQPGLIESIVKQQISESRYNKSLSRTLFELMVPLDYKATAREVDRLVLQVDGYTSNLPWELLQAEKNQPMALKTAMVRQLSTQRYRRNVRTAPNKTACVIVDPSTDNFGQYFGTPSLKRLPPLDGAVREGDIVKKKLIKAQYMEENISFSKSGTRALDVLHSLLSRPYRILVIAAHGVFEARHNDRSPRTGVVLSDGTLITAAEIGQMEVVPELVFLNCCHLAKDSRRMAYNRFAYSISRELIEMGVRCIIAAGWAVDDDAACTFADNFFEQMLIKKESFGNAVHKARNQTYYKHPGNNTWGAYQAYGDPGYRLDPGDLPFNPSSRKLSGVDELLHQLQKMLMNGKRPGKTKNDLKKLDNFVANLRGRSSNDWFELPEVLEALGKLYADASGDGFDMARYFYLKAIAQEDKKGIVAIKTIEQLANMEARVGEKRGDEKLIESAINRIKALISVSSFHGGEQVNNPERSSILGSAYKRLATHYLMNTRKGWNAIHDTLKQSASSYIDGIKTNRQDYPYNTLNYLQFGYLANKFDTEEEKQRNTELAMMCAETARRRYAENGDFWNAVMPADAEVTAWLLGAPIEGDEFEHLKTTYEHCLEGIPVAAREMDSVVTNLCLLSRFLYCRKSKGDGGQAEILEKLVIELEPQQKCEIPKRCK